MEAEVSKRLEATPRTPTGSFHQVVAVSQKTLNNGLHYLFDLYEDLQTMSVTSKDFGHVNAIFDKIEVSLPVKSTKYHTLNYYCIFESGQLVLIDDHG